MKYEDWYDIIFLCTFIKPRTHSEANRLWKTSFFSPLFSRKFSSFYKCQPNFLYFMKVLGQSSEVVEWDRIKFPTIRASLDNKHLPILLMAVKKAIFCSGLCSNLFLIRRIVRIIIFYLGKKHLNQGRQKSGRKCF